MNRLIDTASDRLTADSSRRGFLSTMGKLALGAAALVGGGLAGLGATGTALAVPVCCSGTAICGGGCLSTENTVYMGVCCDNATGQQYNCFKCTSQPNGDYICSYAVNVGTCPTRPARSTG